MKELAFWVGMYFVGFPAIMLSPLVLMWVLYVLGTTFGATFWVVLSLSLITVLVVLYKVKL